jgi:hypothetical protein
MSTLFPTGQSAPLNGYLVIRGASSIKSMLVNSPTLRPEVVSTIPPAVNSPAIVPFFAVGAGYNTALTLINSSDTIPVRVTLSAFSPTGAALLPQAVVRTIATSERLDLDLSTLLQAGTPGQVTVGYLSVAMQGLTGNPFASTPALFAMTRISVGAASTVVPFSEGGTRFAFVPTAETTATYTGIAIMNPLNTPVSVTVEELSTAGNIVGSATFALNPGTMELRLLREIFPQTLTHDNGLFRITSTAAVKVVGMRGALDLSELIYLRGEVTP